MYSIKKIAYGYKRVSIYRIYRVSQKISPSADDN